MNGVARSGRGEGGDRERASTALGKYDLIAELPREDVADVYLAASLAPGGYIKLAVLRVVRPALEGVESIGARFFAASRMAARLHHANILETYEVSQAGPDGPETFAATEYLEGQTLARIVDRVGASELSRGMWLRILADVLAALHHAHEALDDDGRPLGLAHLRLTASDVFVTYDGQVKVLGFGKCETQETTDRTRSLARRAGSVAPEQARGEPADRAADVFAVGALLWEASTRVPLWGDRDERTILAELTEGRIPSLRKADPDVPAPLADIVGRAMSADPDDRYSTAMHFQTDLEGFLRASDDRPAPREIGRMVAHAFLEERLRTTTVVDEQLRRLRSRALASPSEGEGEHVSLLRLETAPLSGRGLGEGAPLAPTSPRPFVPVVAPARSVRDLPGDDREENGPRSGAIGSTRQLVWLVGVVILVLAAILFARAR